MASGVNSLTSQEGEAIRDFAEAVRRDQGRNVVDMRLFGSKARGDAQIESDLDVLVVLRQKSLDACDRIGEIAWEVDYQKDVLLSPLILSEEQMQMNRHYETLLAREIDRDGVPV